MFIWYIPHACSLWTSVRHGTDPLRKTFSQHEGGSSVLATFYLGVCCYINLDTPIYPVFDQRDLKAGKAQFQWKPFWNLILVT